MSVLRIQKILRTSVADVGICRILIIRFTLKAIVVQFCSNFKKRNRKNALPIMSYHILCESEDSWERSIVTLNTKATLFLYSKRKIAKKAVGDQLNIASYQKCS